MLSLCQVVDESLSVEEAEEVVDIQTEAAQSVDTLQRTILDLYHAEQVLMMSGNTLSDNLAKFRPSFFGSRPACG
jgi:hypothetical protein